MSMMMSFVLSFFPRDVLDEILNLIGSVSEGFPSYSCSYTPFVPFMIFCTACVNVILYDHNVAHTFVGLFETT